MSDMPGPGKPVEESRGPDVKENGFAMFQAMSNGIHYLGFTPTEDGAKFFVAKHAKESGFPCMAVPARFFADGKVYREANPMGK